MLSDRPALSTPTRRWVPACTILHSHYGYNMDAPLEQRWRDVVGLEISDGTPEIMKGIVAREAFGREDTAYRE